MLRKNKTIKQGYKRIVSNATLNRKYQLKQPQLKNLYFHQ